MQRLLPRDIPVDAQVTYYGKVPGARQMAVSVLDEDSGANIVYIGTGSSTGMIWNEFQEGKVQALVDIDGDGSVDWQTVLIDKYDDIGKGDI